MGYEKQMNKYVRQGFALQYPNGSLAGIDLSSGGYPYEADTIFQVWIASKDEIEKYIKSGAASELKMVPIFVYVAY